MVGKAFRKPKGHMLIGSSTLAVAALALATVAASVGHADPAPNWNGW